MRGTVLPPGQFSFHTIAALLGPPDWVQKKKDKKQTKCCSGNRLSGKQRSAAKVLG
jgi:hypothetical protein